MESRNKSIPNVIMVVTDGQSQDVPTDAARKLQVEMKKFKGGRSIEASY
jgi:hypothetical protein